MSYVYLMLNKRNGYTKIGFTSKQPTFREKTLQAEEPEIELLDSFYGLSMKDEKALHKNFSEKRIRGEWFDLSELDIYKAKDFLRDRIVKANKNRKFNNISLELDSYSEYEKLLIKSTLHTMFDESSDLTTIGDNVIIAYNKNNTIVKDVLTKLDNGLNSHLNEVPF